MIEAERNQRLTEVGRDTVGGRLLRRYWLPVATAEQLDTEPVRKVRILGEDLALYRDLSGNLGLVAERCPHRGASLAYGFPEPDGLRCPYHGWMFDAAGSCLDTPNTAPDSPRFRAQCRVQSYRVQELGGLVFAYFGPDPAPALPRYDLLVDPDRPTTFRDIGWQVIPCNWLQIMENSFDPLHVEWLHGRLFNYHLELAGEEATVLGGRHVKIGFDPFDHGIIKRRLREGQAETEDDWTIGHPVVFPNLLKVGGAGLSQFQIRVPVDDTHTLHFWYTVYELPEEHADICASVKQLPGTYEVRLQRPDGSFYMDTIDAQDAMAWVTQGAIADRSAENLCSSDRGIVMFRNLLEEQLGIVEAGGEPMNVFAGGSPDVIPLPMEQKDLGIGGGRRNPLASYLRTQARHGLRLTEAARVLDERLTALT